MQISKTIFNHRQVPRSVTILLSLDLLFCFVYVVTHLLIASFVEPYYLWNLDSEGSIASWYSVFKYLGVAVLAALFVYRRMAKGQISLAILGLPTVFLAMGIDEGARLHEQMSKYIDMFLPGGDRANTPFHETGIWMFVIGIPFIIFFLLWIYRLRKELINYRANLRLLTVGMGILLTGAVGFESVSNFLYGTAWLIEVAFEEGFEMVGVSVIWWSMCNMLRQQRSLDLSSSYQN
ncbi:hypothetical protein [Leptolyngbya sp. Heron Island J]|uniref:hypothetical protein n=1 Tax=Leptolyngbya sp. Heron Island J TaxID=1385935 RepID=UPI001268C17B|nr:hypothetical protein [Leptolyngbya sp. Heron Island J]